MGKFDGILLASDLDGTLLCSGKLSEENLKAVIYFMDNGGLFTTATGRSPEFISEMGIPANAPLITSNGSVICDFKTHEVIKRYECPEQAMMVAKETAQRGNIHKIDFFTQRGVFGFNRPFGDDFYNFDETLNKAVLMFDTEEKALEAKADLRKRYGNYLTFERSWTWGLEVISVSAGKGNCLKEIKKLTGATTTIGVGDWENDESLLRAADISYAPESGHPDIKAIADYVTVPCNEHVIAAIVKELDEKGTDL